MRHMYGVTEDEVRDWPMAMYDHYLDQAVQLMKMRQG